MSAARHDVDDDDLVCWLLCHINHCKVFNAISFLYICIKYKISKDILYIIF